MHRMGFYLYLLYLISHIISTSECKSSFYDFSAVDINGKLVNFGRYRGKVLLVVNVASECGFTDNHYKGLVQLQEKFKDTNRLTVLGFPCNQFGAQEPKDESEILKFAESYYNVNFPLFSKVNVKDNDVPDYWRFLTENSGNIPNWNFWKYLINHKGEVINSWGPSSNIQSIYSDVNAAVKQAILEEDNQIKEEELILEDIKSEESTLKVEKHDEM